MKQKWYAVLGVLLFAVLTVGSLAVYAAPLAIADTTRQRGHGQAWWTEGLTNEQVSEIRQKIWDIRAQASAEGWTDEQTMTAIHELLAQYGVTAQGPGFIDANGDGVCDNLGSGLGSGGRGQWRNQCLNQTLCPSA